MFVLRRPIVGFALQHGNFTAANALDTSRALAGFALGLVGFSVYLFMLRAFYAHNDARTPFVINLVENLINIVLAFVLVDRFGRARPRPVVRPRLPDRRGVGLQVLRLQAARLPGARRPRRSLWRMGLAALVMAEVGWLVARVGRREHRRRRRSSGSSWRRSSDSACTSGCSWCCAPRSSTSSRRGSLACGRRQPRPAPSRHRRHVQDVARSGGSTWAPSSTATSSSAPTRRCSSSRPSPRPRQQHRRLKEQAANVIANQKQSELRLNSKMAELEKLNANARQALMMASDAQKAGDDGQGRRSTTAPPRPSPTS